MPSRLRIFRLGDTYGGVNRMLSPHTLPNNVASLTNNWVLRKNGIETVKGWDKFTDQILADGAASPTNSSIFLIDQFFLNDGTSELLAFTESRVYHFNETGSDLWIPITPGTYAYTTVDQDSAAAAATLYVASTTNYNVGDTIIIGDGTAREEEAVIDTISAGDHFTLLSNLTYEHTAAQADEVKRTFGAAIVDSDSAAAQKVLNVSHTGQFSAGEEVIIGKGTAREEIKFIDTISAGVSITMTENLAYEHTSAQADKVHRVAELTVSSSVSDVDTDNTQNTYYMTDGVNAVRKWTGSGYAAPLTGIASTDEGATYPDVEGLGTITSDVRAKYIRAFDGFLVLGHLTEEGTTIPQKVRWSRLDNFESWVNQTDGTGQAGYATFESSDFITGLHQLKRELLVYRERSIEAMSYIGEPFIFGVRRAETGTGLIASRALVDFGDRHMFVGPDNVWEYNGVSLVPIGDPIKDQFFDEVDPSQLGNVSMFFIEERDEVWLCYSTTGNRVYDKAFVYNSLFKKWSGPRDVDGTGFGYYKKTATTSWDGSTGTWNDSTATWNDRTFLSNAPTNMMGNDDGLVFEVDEIATADGSTLSKRYETKLTNLGTDGKKRVQRIRIGMGEHSSATASVYLGRASSVGDSITWEGPVTFNPTDNTDPYVFFDVTSEWFKVRVDTDDYMNIRELELYFYPRTFR